MVIEKNAGSLKYVKIPSESYVFLKTTNNVHNETHASGEGGCDVNLRGFLKYVFYLRTEWERW